MLAEPLVYPIGESPLWLLAYLVTPAAASFVGYAAALRWWTGKSGEARKQAGARLELVFYLSISVITTIAAVHEWPYLGELHHVNPITCSGIGYIVGFFAYELSFLDKRRAHVAHHGFFILLFLVIATRRYYYGVQPLFIYFETISAFNILAYFKRDAPRAKHYFMLNLYVHSLSLALGPALIAMIWVTAPEHDALILGLVIAGVLGNALTVIERLHRSIDRIELVPAPEPDPLPADPPRVEPHERELVDA